MEIKHIPIIGLFSVRIFQSSNSVHLEEILHHQTDGWNPLNHGINHLSTGDSDFAGPSTVWWLGDPSVGGDCFAPAAHQKTEKTRGRRWSSAADRAGEVREKNQGIYGDSTIRNTHFRGFKEPKWCFNYEKQHVTEEINETHNLFWP